MRGERWAEESAKVVGRSEHLVASYRPHPSLLLPLPPPGPLQRKHEAAKMKAEKEAAVKERERLKLELLRDKANRLADQGEG